ncbi:uncharacterized protein LOC107045612 [Diachasma alloeum]|uniref:uncharacterized protein LOC107045612 n=1 Tax=Diachasma alloeum TaxID=454923 RepID=UPI000738353F|nr:uncharacterized protein LOC107045612 [Diachasma alloeum]
MKTIALFAIVLAVAAAEPGLRRGKVGPPPLINRPRPPTGTGSRFRRSPEPEPQGSIVLQGQKPLSGPDRHGSWNLDYQHKIYEGKNGHISASGGVGSQHGSRVGPQVGIQGQWRFRRSPEPEPQGSIVFQGQKPLSGPDRHGSWNLDYQHKIYEGKNGHVSASGGVGSQHGSRVEPQIGIQGQWGFRRSPEPEPQGSIVLQGQKPLSGPDRRGSWGLDYQHKIYEGKNGHISASGGVGSQHGSRVEPQIGIQGQWGFRRSPEPEPQGSIVLQGQKPLSGPDRRGSWGLDYQHKIYEGKNGHISASGGVGSQHGSRVEPQIGIQGQWGFRRSPEPEPQGSIVLQGQKPLSGPDRHGSWNLDYQHKIYEGKNGHVSASGGVGSQHGSRVEPQIGIQGQWRFRRSPEPEPQGSIVLQGQKPLSGPDRRGSWGLDYQHKIYEGKNGHVSASGGVGSQHGSRVGPQVGIQGQWRFRRSAEPEPQGSIVFQGQKPLSGPDRHGSWNLDYQHKIYEGKNGHVSASGGVGSQHGSRVEPQIGIQGQWRFRRSPEPEPQGSIVLQGQKPLSGPDRRGSWGLDYQHKIYEGKNGHVSASGGVGSQHGSRVGPQVGIQGQWRFRRSSESEQ